MVEFAAFVAVGFLAQMIDGALGMAYGVTSNACLLAVGLPPAVASAAVHTAEVGTTAVSGLSHLALKNVDRMLALRLAIPGVAGAIIGSLVAARAPVEWLSPLVSAYLIVIGLRLVAAALRGARQARPPRRVEALGAMGGFCDAVGGGGWGPIVASSLLSTDLEPRKAIGTGNLAEFAVAAASAGVFWAVLGPTVWQPTLGLLLGGVLAAPLAAYTVSRAPRRPLMGAVGLLLVIVSVRGVLKAF